MIGLEITINEKKKATRSSKFEKFSYSYIAKLLGLSFSGISKKCKKGTFTTQEALAIFNSLVSDEKLKTLEFFEYLFTEQD